MLDTFAKQKLDDLIAHFSATVSTEMWAQEILSRETRKKNQFGHISSRSNLENITYEAFCGMIEELWALRGWHNKAWFIENQMQLNSANYKTSLSSLADLLFNSNDLEERLKSFMDQTSGFGLAIVSELLTLSSSGTYPLYNAKSQAVLKSLHIDLKDFTTRGKKRDIHLYVIFNKVYSNILDHIRTKLPQIDDYYKLDAFFWLINFSDKVEKFDDSKESEDDNVIVVKMGSTSDLEKIKTLWKKHSVASFGFEELDDFDPAKASEDHYASLKLAMEAKGASEGLIRKVASYVHIFFSAKPNRDWIIAYHKGKIYGYGRVTSSYSRLGGLDSKHWNQSVGVKWTWLDHALDVSNTYPNLYQECGKNSSVSLVKKRSAKSEFYSLVKANESDADIEIENPDGITLEEISLQTYLPKGYLEQLISSFVDPDGKRQIIFDGPPGTGKTFVAQQLAKFLTNGEGTQKGDWKIVPCHGALSYDHIFQALAPDQHGKIAVKSGVITEFAKKAAENEHANYVLILDEINRANIHQVFGPLLFLLEYRGSEMDLPFGSETTMLPPNLLIIATMNSDDRSAGSVDFAFRRRFLTWSFNPSKDILKNYLNVAFPSNDGHGVDHQKVVSLFEKLNFKLAKTDSKFQIGHSYFMTYYPLNEAGLQRLWETEILPLLEDKFFHNRQLVKAEYSLSHVLNEQHETQISAEDLVPGTGTD